MSEKREYRSAVRSRRMIREAFLLLLEEKEFDKITVTDIVSRADLNRSTFYHHYPDVHGVVEEMQSELVEKNIEWIRQMKYHNILEDPVPYLGSICDTLEENIRLYTKMGRIADASAQIDKYLRQIAEEVMNHSEVPENVRTSPLFETRFHFFIGGLINTYLQWSEGKMHCTLAELSQEIATLIRNFSLEMMDAAQ